MSYIYCFFRCNYIYIFEKLKYDKKKTINVSFLVKVIYHFSFVVNTIELTIKNGTFIILHPC